MKISLNLVILLLVSCSTTKLVNTTNPNIDVHQLQEFAFGKYRVIKVDSINNIYIVYAKKDNLLFKIASLRTDDKNCSFIKVNGEYGFNLHSLFPKQITGHEIMPNCFVTGVDYYGTPISKEKGCVDDLFFADNLNGLCIK